MSPATLAMLATLPEGWSSPIYFEGLVLDLEVLYEVHQQFRKDSARRMTSSPE